MATEETTSSELDEATRAEVDAVTAQVLEDMERKGALAEAPPTGPTPNTPEQVGRFARARGLRVNEPARPELEPGESVTTEPDRWCSVCNEARGGKRCPTCRNFTKPRIAIEDAEEYEPAPLVRGRRDANRNQRRVELDDEDLEDLDDEELDERVERVEYERVQVAAAAGGRFARANAREREMPREREAPRGREAPQGRRHGMRTKMHQGRGNLRAVERGQRDEAGYEVQETLSRRHGGRPGRGMRTAYEELDDQWAKGSVMLELWWQGFSALLKGCETTEDVQRVAELADDAYIEMMVRQRKQQP